MKPMCLQSEAGCDVCAFFTERGGFVIGQLFLQLFAFSYHIITRHFFAVSHDVTALSRLFTAGVCDVLKSL